jgi:hypothetical protein
MATRRRPADLADHSWERVAAREVSRLVVIAPPWLGWAALPAAGAGLHRAWPGGVGAACVALAAAGLAVLDLHLTRQRKGLGRYLAAVTTLAAGVWLAWVMAGGLHSPAVKAWLVGGGALAMAWTRWLHVHEAGDEAGMAKPFGQAALKAGFATVKLIRSKVISDGVTKAVIDHPGVVHDEIVKAVPQLEAAWPKPGGLPPGTITATRNPDSAGRTDVVFSDPRVLSRPVPWPGPSAPGTSIADPIVVGRWQDGTPAAWRQTGYHEQFMAMTGAGKTMGALYSTAGEIITRHDAFMVAADLAKGSQFLGPLAPALHYVASTPAQFRALLETVERSCIPRAEHLGALGLDQWRPGCGLRYGYLWIEEAADAFESLGADIEEFMFPLLRKIRSAGWSLIYSLHRASYDQMPTFLRDMVALTTMGCNSWEAARFGLSPVQIESDACHPELWGDDPDHRGKFYRHAPVLDRPHRLMAGRYWDWGPGTAKMREHAARYPASGRPFDDVTAPLFLPLLGPVSPVPAPAQRTATAPAPAATLEENDDMNGYDDDLDLDDLPGADLPIGTGGPPPGPEIPVSPELALTRVREQIQEWRAAGGVERNGQRSDVITALDFRELTGELGRARTWIYSVMPRLEAEGEIATNTSGTGWMIRAKAGV